MFTFVEYYGRCHCPDCKTVNWFYSGRNDDDCTSGSDLLALKCWKCGKSNWLNEFSQEEAQSMYGEYDEDDNPVPVLPENCADEGKEAPRW